jgi:polyisoprenoid-binding protein YceI
MRLEALTVHSALNQNLVQEGAIVRYGIDTRASTFKVRAFATGLLSAFGHSPNIAIRDFSGEARFHPETLDLASLQIRIPAASLTVADDISDKDRREMERQMREEVLEVSKYPEVVYDCQRASIAGANSSPLDVTLHGELILHGVSQPQPVSARVFLLGDSLRASGQFSVLQSAYGIKPVTAVGGAIKLKDELKFTFDILARKQA